MTLPNNQKNEGQHGKVRLLISKIENAHVLDSSGSYNIITDIFCHEDSSPTLHNDVTLVSQTSSNNLDDVIALSERWDDRTQLLRNWRLKKIRPFYFDVCQKCQRPTDYDQWQFLPDSSHLNIAYFVQREDAYEPFYIAKKDFPLYDERFKQYGYNRISQVCEMNIAGYNFGVLNNAFLIHKGFKYRDGFHKNKEIENNRNRDLFQQFKRELRTKYPNSKRSW
ncbi:Hypothetical predicted protein [Mytilus galloprovincialis]|uniref:Beta-1,4-glucuronyltransferase 1 n=1 Tax=Mytilus galloprovincialis TaxID=29158 RepID=A0A8B6FBE4_MYTGA|nr:Hypothetical predicted protein [Mytilus galloprovincialis]